MRSDSFTIVTSGKSIPIRIITLIGLFNVPIFKELKPVLLIKKKIQNIGIAPHGIGKDLTWSKISKHVSILVSQKPFMWKKSHMLFTIAKEHRSGWATTLFNRGIK